MDSAEIINLDSLGSLDDDTLTGKPSVNFGGGIELLMNDKVKSGGSSGNKEEDIGLDDLNNLESELNNLTDTVSSAPIATPKTNDVPLQNIDNISLQLMLILRIVEVPH
jgi:hypothetical protein